MEDETKIKFAFAVNTNNLFLRKHFGDADKFLIYEVQNDSLQITEEVKNLFKDHESKKVHGSLTKGTSIIEFLKSKGVTTLVSKKFGQNLKLVSKHFIPIIIFEDEPENALEIIYKHMHWIQDEWINKDKDFSVFTIKSGILKTKIEL